MNQPTPDPDLLKRYALDVWKYKQGEMVSLMIHLGDRLGLYRTMAGGETWTPERLADNAGLDERMVREWLLGQAAAGLITRSPSGEYRLGPEGEAVLVDEGALSFAAGAFIGGFPPDRIEAMADAFRTGRGFSFSEQGEETARQIDRMNAPWLSGFLLDEVLPGLDGVAEKLEAGAHAADVGCGGGIALHSLARRFPASHFVGYEPSGPGSERARARTADLPNARIVQAPGEELPAHPPLDLAMTLDCLHDMPFPDRAAAAIRRALKPDGTWLIKDMRCSEVFEKNLKNPVLAMQYGYSISSCLASATSQPGGAALGTLGLPPSEVERLAGAAGFSSVRVISLEDDPVHLYYEVRA